ncbi:MAG: hypothetical protein ABJB86_04965 [Bacteroidota bacterium]
MLLLITKNENKPHIIRYKRDDGTDTWMKTDEYFVRHDISHYAPEKTLGYKTAFMAMLNNGMDIQDFENREKRLKLTITREACYAENMANLFLMETTQGNSGNFNQLLTSAFTNMQQPFSAPVLGDDEIDSVKKYLKELIHQWNELPVGETMRLEW